MFEVKKFEAKRLGFERRRHASARPRCAEAPFRGAGRTPPRRRPRSEPSAWSVPPEDEPARPAPGRAAGLGGTVMTTATETGFAALSITEAAAAQENGERQNVRLRGELGIGAFGVNAVRAVAAGTRVIGEHDEAGPGSDGHEELYIVLSGHAVFTVAGEQVDAPLGTAVFVRDPELRRSAVAKEDGTLVVAVGAPAGKPFTPTPGEAMRDFLEPYNAKDYAAALKIGRGILHRYPGNPLALYNIACMEALLGAKDDALKHLGEALAGSDRLRENARTDDDFASLRGDPQFEELIAS